MLVLKAGNAGSVMWLAVARAELGVTFSTCRIRGRLKKHGALVFYVAGRACRSEYLVGVMQRRIVAGEASFVGDVRRKLASLSNVAEPALLREYSMRPRKLPA